LLFDVVAILPSKEGATRLAAVSAARDFISDALTNHMFTIYVDAAMPLLEKVSAEPDGGFIRLNKPKDCSAFVKHCRTLRFWERTER
jgi:catalase